eukprot:COSAG01_NODE_6471_length_3646_cov_1.377784_2_plen_150_part_00
MSQRSARPTDKPQSPRPTDKPPCAPVLLSKSLQLYYCHRCYQAGDRGTSSSWADEMRRWKVERRAVTAAAPSNSQSSELDGDAPASAVPQSESDRPIGVNSDPDPGPTEASLLAAAAAEALKRDEAGILADTSIVSPAPSRSRCCCHSQ